MPPHRRDDDARVEIEPRASDAPAAPASREAFELRGRRTTLSALRLLSTDVGALDTELAAKIARAPGMFDGLPVVLELDALTGGPRPGQLTRWVEAIRSRGLVPIGIGAGHGAEEEARALGLSVLPENRGSERPERRVAEEPEPEPPAEPAPEAKAEPVCSPTRIIDQPVRSGQQIYAEGGDLVIMAAVSPGAEVLADGNIFVFGPLRGRALAGLHGDPKARILCRSLEAELVSIAGWYETKEELEDEKRPRSSVQIYLEGEKLRFVPFEL